MNSFGYFQVILIINTDWIYYRYDRLSEKSSLLIMFRCLGMQISHALLQNRTNSYRHPKGIDHMAPEMYIQVCTTRPDPQYISARTSLAVSSASRR